ncbi:MAG: YbjN domain-containing protein [Lachnospiraceae bacterium]|nr:YbjN domain-containing protein [Lachnospiraceae bacterium]
MDERKKSLLKALEEDWKDAEGVGRISLFTREELGAPMDILRAEIMDYGAEVRPVLGEFFFLPLPETEVLYFVTVITLSDSLPEDRVYDAGLATARLNYYLPFGCFALGDHDKNLVFRHSIPVMGNQEEKDQFLAISNAANTAVIISEQYEGYLRLALNGDITVEEMAEMAGKGN